METVYERERPVLADEERERDPPNQGADEGVPIGTPVITAGGEAIA
jgi:hypothetical protein